MSAAESARKRADETTRQLARDAESIRRDLDRMITDLRAGSVLGTRSLVQQMSDLDRKACYLRGLNEGRVLGEGT